jgi:hypothetical protein
LIADQFEGLGFLDDDNVRENSIKHGLVHLQETLLYDILGKMDIKLGIVNKGIPHTCIVIILYHYYVFCFFRATGSYERKLSVFLTLY